MDALPSSIPFACPSPGSLCLCHGCGCRGITADPEPLPKASTMAPSLSLESPPHTFVLFCFLAQLGVNHCYRARSPVILAWLLSLW